MSFFSKLINKIFKKDNNDISEDLFSQIEEGSIVYAKRDINDEDRRIDGHDIGPFLIIKKEKNHLLGLYITSKKKDTSYYKWAKISFNDKVNSYVYTTASHIITKDNYVNNWGKLNNESFNYLKKHIYLNRFSQIDGKDSINIYYSQGDVVMYKGKYFYIQSRDNENIYTYEVYLSTNDKYSLKIRNNKYLIQYDKKNTFNIKDLTSFELVDTIEKETSVDIENAKEKLLQQKIEENIQSKIIKDNKNINDNNVISRGCIVHYKTKNYYIYGEYKDKWLVYELNDDGLYSFQLSGEEYKSNLENEEILMKEKLNFILRANKMEINAIKKLKKPKKKTAQVIDREFVRETRDLQPGQIIYNGRFRLVVVSYNKNVIVCYNSLNNKFIFLNNYKNEEWKKCGVVSKDDLYYIKGLLQSNNYAKKLYLR